MNRRTPLIIWTKNKDVQKKLRYTNSNVMGMYDVLPTIGNMMGFKNDFALGHDIYDIKEDNVVIFPSNGNFVTNKIFYYANDSTYLALEKNIVLEADYIEKLKQYAEERLEISNDIIVYDLIKQESSKIYEILNSPEEGVIE